MSLPNLKFNIDLPFTGVSVTQLALFAKAMSVMLTAGIPVTEALRISAESTSGKFKKVLESMYTSIESGHSLSASMIENSKIFNPLIISTVQVAESSGTLPDNFITIAEQLEKERQLLSKIRGVLIYPAIILSAVIGLGIFVVFFVFPKIIPLFTQLRIELPLTTRILVQISNIVDKYGLTLLIGLLTALFSLPWLLKLPVFKPITHFLLIQIPMIKDITRSAGLATFCRTLGTLIKSGVSIDEAMSITKQTTANYYYQKALSQIADGVIQGSTLSENLARYPRLFPSMIIRMVTVGEKSGSLDTTLMYLAEFYDQEVDGAAKNIPTILEPVLLLFIGLIVGFLALSIMTPIFKITGGVRR